MLFSQVLFVRLCKTSSFALGVLQWCMIALAVATVAKSVQSCMHMSTGNCSAQGHLISSCNVQSLNLV